MGSISGWGTKIPHAAGQPSQCITIVEPKHSNEDTAWSKINKLLKHKNKKLRIGRPEGEALKPCHDSRAQREERSPSLLSQQQFSQRNAMDSLFTVPSQLSVPSVKARSSLVTSAFVGDLHVAHHGCRPRSAILC